MMGSSSTLPLQPGTGTTDCCTAPDRQGTCSAFSRGSNSWWADGVPCLQTNKSGLAVQGGTYAPAAVASNTLWDVCYCLLRSKRGGVVHS